MPSPYIRAPLCIYKKKLIRALLSSLGSSPWSVDKLRRMTRPSLHKFRLLLYLPLLEEVSFKKLVKPKLGPQIYVRRWGMPA